MVSGVRPKKGVVKESQDMYAIFNHAKSDWSVDNFSFKPGLRIGSAIYELYSLVRNIFCTEVMKSGR